MLEAPNPPDEAARIASLQKLGILFTPAEERFDRITRLARKIFNVPMSWISIVAGECQWFKSAQGTTESQTPRKVSFCGHAIMGDEALVVLDAHQDSRFADNPLVTGVPHIRFYAGQPIKFGGMNIGTLCLIDTKPRGITDGELETLRSLGLWIENELKLSLISEEQKLLLAQLDEARRNSYIDPLTKTWNRRGMEELLQKELQRCQNEGLAMAMLIADVDFFKQVNDNFGHPFGDVVLKEVAQFLRMSVRPSDMIARYGGDEFVIFLSNCQPSLAKSIAQRILKKAAEERITADKNTYQVSLSIGGCAARNADALNLNRIIEMADTALYEVKDAGRSSFRIHE